MTFKIAVISRDLSRFLLIPLGMALLSLPICVLSGEWFAIAPFVATILVAGALSWLCYALGQNGAGALIARNIY